MRTKKYWIYFDEERNLIGQTVDKDVAKTFEKRMKRTKVKYEKLVAELTKDETVKLKNFLSMELMRYEPYSEEVYTDRELESYMYYLFNVKDRMEDSIRTMNNLMYLLKFSETERRVIDDYLGYSEYIFEDLEYFTPDGCLYEEEGGVAPEDHFDIDKIIRSMQDGSLEL